MKRLLLAGVVASVTMLGAASLAPSPASATDPITRLTRQVRSLQGQVTSLKQRVGDLEHLAYTCDFYDSSNPVTFDDGTVGYPLYADPAC